MTPDRISILKSMPEPDMVSRVFFKSGGNQDIIDVIHRNLAPATGQARSIAKSFKGASDLETGRRIWDFLKNQISYKRDPDGRQDIRLPSRFITDGTGDCKSFSLFTAAILSNLGIPFRFRYTSYTSDPTPQHVYVVTESGVIIDGVWKSFNSEKPYTFKKDYTMKISALSGVGCTECTNLSGIDSVMIGSIGKIKIGSGIKKAASKVQKAVKNTAVVKKAAKIQTKAKDTKVIKTLSKLQNEVKEGGVKSVALAVPRRAYRTLVSLNWRGWAAKLASNIPETKKIWAKAGGSWPELEKSINTGKNKKALFGSKNQQIKTVDGIGDAALATIGAILTAAAPLILLFKNLTKDSGGTTETPGDEVQSSETGSGNTLTDLLDNVTEIFSGKKTDASPGQNQTSPQSEVPSAPEKSSSNGLLLLGAAAVAFLLLKK